MTADQLRAFTLLTVMLTAHVGLFTLTNLWFRKGMAKCSEKTVAPNIVLFFLGNLWPLTWTAYLVYASCAWVTGRMRMSRINELIKENNQLEESLTLSRNTVSDLEEAYVSLREQLAELRAIEIHRKSHEDARSFLKKAKEVSDGLRSLEDPRTELPPYTPDVWKAIRELERRLNGTESYIKHRDHLEELY